MIKQHQRKYLLLQYLGLMVMLMSAKCDFAQTLKSGAVDSIIDKIGFYGIKTDRPALFVHFDKTVYTDNDNVWFTAYLLSRHNDLQSYNTLAVALVKDDSRAIVLADRFLMRNGIAFGNLFLPDSIIPGNYSLVACTNRLIRGQPVEVFVQPITVKTTVTPSFNATLFVADTARKFAGATRKVILMVNSANTHPLPGIGVEYSVGSPIHPTAKGKVVTDKAGQYEFNIPVKQISPGKNTFQVQIKQGTEAKVVSVALPADPPPPVIRFYPEGGNLVNDVQSVIGWEAKNTVGNPLKVEGVLYKDNKPVETIATNSYGLGRFKLIPQKGSNYSVKLLDAQTRDTLYHLPASLESGPVVHIAQALANDSLIVRVQNKTPGKLYLIGHNYRDVFFFEPVLVGPTERTVKVMLKNMPKGIVQLTVADSTGKPFAARLFFAHYNKKEELSIITDNTTYTNRQKVNVKLQLSGPANKNKFGIVSVACVQDNRVELRKMNDIESYVYLKRELDALPLKENILNGNTAADRQYLEDVLLIKGWRRYTWTDAMKATGADTIVHFDTTAFNGKVALVGKPLKKPVLLISMRDSSVTTLATDNAGAFDIPYNKMIDRQDKKIKFIVTGAGDPKDYVIAITDPYQALNKMLAMQLEPDEFIKATAQNTGTGSLKGFEHANNLREVKITEKLHSQLYGGPGTNECGDYVCPYHILNCPNHHNNPNNRPPVVGETYSTYGRPEVYRGCNPADNRFFVPLNAIAMAKEFYPSDYEKVSPVQPEYLSTIFWKHLLKVNTGEAVNLSFYTSDITGTFKIIVQGITNDDVVFGTASFNVVKPQAKQ